MSNSEIQPSFFEEEPVESHEVGSSESSFNNLHGGNQERVELVESAEHALFNKRNLEQAIENFRNNIANKVEGALVAIPDQSYPSKFLFGIWAKASEAVQKQFGFDLTISDLSDENQYLCQRILVPNGSAQYLGAIDKSIVKNGDMDHSTPIVENTPLYTEEDEKNGYYIDKSGRINYI